MTAPKYPMPADWPCQKRKAFRTWALWKLKNHGASPTWEDYDAMLEAKPATRQKWAHWGSQANQQKALARLTDEERAAVERGEVTACQVRDRKRNLARCERQAEYRRIRRAARKAGAALGSERITADDRRRNAARAELSRMRVEALLRRRGIGR